jgi:hypothetical protein
MTDSLIDSLPLWVVNLFITGVSLLAIELGVQLGSFRRRQGDVDVSTPINSIVGATLGLLAFLLAFTFSMAADRYDIRRQIVLQMANGIGTTYLRADFLPAVERDEVRAILREYAVHQSGGMSTLLAVTGIEKTTLLNEQLWAVTARAGVAHDSESVSLFIQSVNDTIDLSAARVTAFRNRIPLSVWAMFSVVTTFSMISIGYEFGLTKKRSWPATLLLVFVFTTVITLILDLDTPQSGIVRVSQQPLLDVIDIIAPVTP